MLGRGLGGSESLHASVIIAREKRQPSVSLATGQTTIPEAHMFSCLSTTVVSRSRFHEQQTTHKKTVGTEGSHFSAKYRGIHS